jgi:hypothetical protein
MLAQPRTGIGIENQAGCLALFPREVVGVWPNPTLILRLLGFSVPAIGHRVYPYRLRGVAITKSDQVWSTDITYIRFRQGFVYLVAIIDWHSRSNDTMTENWRPKWQRVLN